MKDAESQQSETVKSTYQAWLEREGIPVVSGYSVDIRTVATGPWRRRGGLGAYINLEGAHETDGAYIAEIPSASKLEPEKHLYEELIYVIAGQGRTEVWNEGKPKQSFDWQEGSLFSPPLNAWHQDFNRRQDMPAKYLAVTSAPLVMNLFHNIDFVFNNSYSFRDRYDGQKDYFSPEGKVFQADSLWHEWKGQPWRELIIESSFIPDVRTAPLKEYAKAPGSRHNRLMLADNTMGAHTLEVSPGTYATAHRHEPGAFVIWLSGKGYTLIWPEGGERIRIDWHDGTMLVPPAGWFHQHFVTGTEPALHLALIWRNKAYPIMGQMFYSISLQNRFEKTHNVPYEEEDPEIRRMYQEELKKEGLAIKMP